MKQSYRLMSTAFSDSLMAFGCVETPSPKILKTTKGVTMKFLPDVGIHILALNQKQHKSLFCHKSLV